MSLTAMQFWVSVMDDDDIIEGPVKRFLTLPLILIKSDCVYILILLLLYVGNCHLFLQCISH